MQAYPFLYRSIGLVDDLINNVSYSLDCKGKLHLVCTESYESNLTADNGGNNFEGHFLKQCNCSSCY